MTGLDDVAIGEDEAVLDSVATTKRTGEVLAAARAEAGLELADIAKETRVPLRHLKAIEADAHDQLPALPYTIGFVRSFARAVHLDPETVARQFKAETTKTPHQPSVVALEPLDERRLPSRGLVVASVAAVLIIVGGLAAWGSGMFDPAPETVASAPVLAPAASASDATTAPAAAPDAGAAPVATGGEAAIPVTTAPAPADPSLTAPTTANAAGTAAVTGTPLAPAAAPVRAGPVMLVAKEDVWLKVYDKATRTTAKIGLMKAGERFAVPAEPAGLLLWTGKAGALAVTVNGKVIAPLGGPVETVRDVSLDPASLLARGAPPVAAPVAGAVPGAPR